MAGVTVIALACAPGGCQVPRGSWVSSTRQTEIIVQDQSWVSFDFSGMVGTVVTADEAGLIYLLRHGPPSRYHRARYDPTVPSNRIAVELPGSMPFANGYIAATRSKLWVLGLNGDVGHVSKAINGAAFTAVGNVFAQNALGSGVVSSVFVDGRDLFFTTGTALTRFSTDPARLWALDTTGNGAVARLVTTFALPAPNLVQVTRGRDGNLVVMGYDGLYEVDPRNGAQALRAWKPLDPDFGTQVSPAGQIVVAYDPWTDVVAVGPAWHVDITNIYSLRLSGSGPFTPAYYFPFFSGLGSLANASESPFEYLGKGCLNGLGREPRMGWRGLPRQGQSFTLELRAAEPNGLAIFWLGVSDTQWPGLGPLPFDAGILGAPGCRLYASNEASYLVPVDGVGEARLAIPVPLNPAVYGFEVYAQTASTSGGNVLGFAASDALVIRLR